VSRVLLVGEQSVGMQCSTAWFVSASHHATLLTGGAWWSGRLGVHHRAGFVPYLSGAAERGSEAQALAVNRRERAGHGHNFIAIRRLK